MDGREILFMTTSTLLRVCIISRICSINKERWKKPKSCFDSLWGVKQGFSAKNIVARRANLVIVLRKHRRDEEADAVEKGTNASLQPTY
jgi:hypothetical protein